MTYNTTWADTRSLGSNLYPYGTTVGPNISGSADDDEIPVTEYTLYQAAILLIKVAFPILVLTGSVGNIMVILVLRRGAIRTDNLTFLLSALAVVDTVFLYTSAFQTWLRVMWDVRLLHFGSWSCKLGLFLNQLSLTLSAWLVVVVAWQRWYTCSRPFQRCCPVETPWCSRLALTLLLLVLVAFNSYVLVTAELYEENGRKLCAPSEHLDEVIGWAFPYIVMALYSVLPASLLFLLNGLLAGVLYSSRRSLLSHRDSARADAYGASALRLRYNYVTVLLLVLSLSWLLLTTPHSVFKIVEPLPNSNRESAQFMFLNVLFYVFMYINHSINFFLYCALTRSFRREVTRMARRLTGCVRKLARCAHCCARQRRLHSSTSTSSQDHFRPEPHHQQCWHPHQQRQTDSSFPLLEPRRSGKSMDIDRQNNRSIGRHRLAKDCM